MKYTIQRLFTKQKFAILLVLTATVFRSEPTSGQIPFPPPPPLTAPPDSSISPQKADSLVPAPKKPALIFPNDTLAQVSFQILNQRSLQSIFAEDISDWFRLLNSVHIFDPGATGQETYFSFQGTNSRQSRLFLDYRPFYDPISGKADLTLIPMEFMESVNSDNISDPLFFSETGAITLRTTPFRGLEPYSQIYHHKAPRGFSDVDFRFGQQVSRRTNIMVGGHIKSNDGRNEAYLYEHQNLRARINLLFSRQWRMQYSVINHSVNRKFPGYYIDDQFAAPSAKQKLTRTDHTINFFGKMLNSHTENFRGALYFSTQSTKLSDADEGKTENDESRYIGTNFAICLKRGTYSASLISNGELIDGNTADFGKKTQAKAGAFLRQSWQPGKIFSTALAAGFRWQNDFSPQFSGSFSQIFSAGKSWKFTLRADRSVRFPFLNELYAASPLRGNQSLLPETVDEIAVQGNFSTGQSVRLFTTGFFKNIENEIRYQFSDTTSFIATNFAPYHFYGANFAAEFYFLRRLKLQSTAMLLQDCRTGNLPLFSAKTALEYWNQFFKGDLRVLFRIEGEYLGERDGEVFHPYQAKKMTKKLDPAMIMNFFANLKFGKLQFYFLLENILDEKYDVVYGYPMNPRSFHYGIRWEFWN